MREAIPQFRFRRSDTQFNQSAPRQIRVKFWFSLRSTFGRRTSISSEMIKRIQTNEKIDTVVSTKSSCFDNWNGSFNSFQMKSFVSFPFKIEFIVLIFAFGCFDFERFTSATWWCYLTVSKRITSIKSILAWKVSSTNAFSWFCQMNIVHFDLSNFFSYEKSEGWI